MRIYVEEYLGNNKARWSCPIGHTWKGNLLPVNKRTKMIGEAGRKMMASWWSRAKGGVTGKCRQCK